MVKDVAHSCYSLTVTEGAHLSLAKQHLLVELCTGSLLRTCSTWLSLYFAHRR